MHVALKVTSSAIFYPVEAIAHCLDKTTIALSTFTKLRSPSPHLPNCDRLLHIHLSAIALTTSPSCDRPSQLPQFTIAYNSLRTAEVPMQTTKDQIRERLALLPETRLQEVLLFVDFLVSRLGLPIQSQPSPSFSNALQTFRLQVENEGSDLEEVDFFEDVRDCRRHG
ncbi:MAG: hypothetical protein F6K35_40935 [Okeania sp. SIO2H7]|nr:hypothetical protein [Okeania sp. SIO2H7]